MRHLPKAENRTERQERIIEACFDYYAGECNSAKKIALYLMGRKKGAQPLTEEEKDAMFCIRGNLQAGEYRQKPILARFCPSFSFMQKTYTPIL